MPKYIFDTNIWIDFLIRAKEFPKVEQIIQEPNFLLQEIWLEIGNVLPKIKDSQNLNLKPKTVSKILSTLKSYPFLTATEKDYELALKILSKETETTIGITDSLLVSICKSYDLTLLTRDQELLKLAEKGYLVKNPYNNC
jgi:predicted nucleic acid-binding protein